MQFPQPLVLPDCISNARKKRLNTLVKAAYLGLFVRFFVVLIELIGFYQYQSRALLFDGLLTLFDVFSTALLILSMKLASRPPDRNHPFGHGRYEPIAGFLIAIFLTFTGVFLAVFQGEDLSLEKSHTQFFNAWQIPLISALLLECCYHILLRSAKKEHSPALKADAIHYRVDALTSLLATLSLLLTLSFPGYGQLLDGIGALLIALFMIVMGVFAAIENIHQLMDRAPEEQFFTLVRDSALKVKGVQETEKIRIQQYGPDAHVDIDIEVIPQMSVEKAHMISQKVRYEIQKNWPAVRDVTVHIEPYYPGDH